MKKFIYLSAFISAIFIAVIFSPISTSAMKRLPYRGPYIKESKDIKLVCGTYCPIRRDKLDKIFDIFESDLKKLEKKVGIPLPASEKPFEIHPSFDKFCREYSSLRTKDPTVMGFTNNSHTKEGIICLRGNTEDFLTHPSWLMHELAHHYFPMIYDGKENIEEDFAMALNHWALGNYKTMCNSTFKKHSAGVYNICKQYGFDYRHMSTLIAWLMQLEQQGKPVTDEMFKAKVKEIAASF